MATAPTAEGPSNQVVVLSVLARLGGVERFVDIEELTLAAFEAAPGRFGWRTRPKLPSPERVRWALVHANQRDVELVVQSQDGASWRLTAEGVRFVKEHASEMQRTHGIAPMTGKETGRAVERVAQLRRHLVFRAYLQGSPVSDRPRHEIADLLLAPPDAPKQLVLRRVDAAKAQATAIDDREIENFLDQVEREVVRQWS